MTEVNPAEYLARLAALKADNEAKGYSFSQRSNTSAATPAAPTPVITPAVINTGGLDDGAKRQLRTLPLLDIYIKWFNPQSVRPGGGDEVNVSCFNTSFHRGGDANPQLGFNTAKNTYYCHACNVTGDIIDLAAVKYGLDDSNWQCPDYRVHEAVRYAGEELLGMRFNRTPAGWQRVQELRQVAQYSSVLTTSAPAAGIIAPPRTGGLTLGTFVAQPLETVEAPAPAGLILGTFQASATEALKPNLENLATAPYTGPRVEIQPENNDEEPAKPLDFQLDWRSFVPANTPLDNYLRIVCVDDSPEEFHFWNFMSLIGLAMGRKVFLPDVKPVYGNMLLCLIGRTGQGKSRSEGYISDLLRTALPFDEQDHMTNGVRVVKNPGSGEYMSKSFIHQVEDPTQPAKRGQITKVLTNPSVKALISWPEMATMVGKGSAAGSIVQTTVIDLYDVPNTLGGGSLKNGSYEARNPFGSVTTTTQLSSIRRLVTTNDAGSGFLNRWWFIIGKSKPFEPWGSHVSVAPIKHDVEMLTKWAEDKFRKDNGWHKISDDARQVASEFLVNRCHPLEANEHDEMMRRAVLTFKKLVLLFSANMMEAEVSVSAVEQAKKAFEYIVSCMQHIGARVGETDFEIALSETMDAIMKSVDGGVRPSDLKKILKRKTKQPTETIDQHIKNMVLTERIELVNIPQPAGRVGAPSKRYRLCED